MSLFLTLTLLAATPFADNEWRTYLLLYVNDVQHMTIERWTTPRVIKRFRVLDAETRRPVPGARVVCVHNFDWMNDWVFEGVTDAQGVAAVPLARDYLHLLHAHAAAEGYLTRDHLYFSDGARDRGIGRLSDDPIDIYLYRGPEPVDGLRLPDNFRGTIVYRGGGATGYDFAFPPDFPAGQRVWWTDVVAGRETILAGFPRLGWSRGRTSKFIVVDAKGRPLPCPDPGADVKGLAAWSIGNLEPDGPWGGQQCVLVIGDRDAALAEAKKLWQQHHNGPTGYIFDGWLRVLSPQTTRSSTTDNPAAVTRIAPDR